MGRGRDFSASLELQLTQQSTYTAETPMTPKHLKSQKRKGGGKARISKVPNLPLSLGIFLGMAFVMKPAQADDLDTVIKLLHDRVDWLRQIGSDQWSTSDTFRMRLEKAIERQQTWLLLDSDGRPIGTITLRTKGSSRYWTPEELQEPALYIAKMATAVTHRGQGLGKWLILWARDWAAQQGLAVVRWDAWRTNSGLIQYYQSLGARYMRTESEKARFSGALFEMPAQRMPDLAVQTCICKNGSSGSFGE